MLLGLPSFSASVGYSAYSLTSLRCPLHLLLYAALLVGRVAGVFLQAELLRRLQSYYLWVKPIFYSIEKNTLSHLGSHLPVRLLPSFWQALPPSAIGPPLPSSKAFSPLCPLPFRALLLVSQLGFFLCSSVKNEVSRQGVICFANHHQKKGYSRNCIPFLM